MTERLARGFPVDLEVRGDGRTLAGIAVPYDKAANIGGRYDEVFRLGAFRRTISERGDRVKLLTSHSESVLPIGRATTLREDTAGLYAEFRVSPTIAGDEALTLVRDGAVDSLSVGFVPVTDRWSTDHRMVERLEVALYEVSLVGVGAYDDARVLAVRHARPLSPHTRLALLRRRLSLAERGIR